MIHEILSSEAWLKPQIDYLVYIQNLRISCDGLFDSCFLNITALGELFIPTLVICLVYWCVNSYYGLYLFTLNASGLILGNLLKMVACVYRPWILSNRIKPIEYALKMSGGYSFPSGHSAMASTSWGGFAFLLRKKIWACIGIIFLVLLIAFSRTYVGVHTPQDVIVGIVLGIILIFAVHYILCSCEKDKNRYMKVLLIFNIFAILSAIYVLTKHYPADYIAGKLLVNPNRAIFLFMLHTGWGMGLVNGALICKRFFPFDAKSGTIKERIIRGFIGLVFLLCIFFPLNDYFFSGVRNYYVSFLTMFLVGFFITAGYPLIFTKISKFAKN